MNRTAERTTEAESVSLRAKLVQIALTLLALGLWWWGVRNWPKGYGAEAYGAGFPAWVASFAVLLSAWMPAPRRPRLRWTVGRTLIVIVGAAAALILFYRVAEVPFAIHFDECTGFENLQAMDRGLAGNIFSMARTETTEPGPCLGLEWVIGLFTPNRFVAFRYNAALWGILTILVTYALGRRLQSATVALIAAVFLTCSYWLVISSRFNQSLMAPCAAGLIWWSVVRACDSGRPFDAIVAGIITGLGLQLYDPVKIMLVAVPLWWLWHALVTERFARRTIMPVAVTAIVAWMVLEPLIQREGVGYYFGRASAVTALGAGFRHTAVQQTSTLGFLRTQFARQLRIITGRAEMAPELFSDDPMLNGLEVGAIAIGLAVSVRRWRSWRETIAPIVLVLTAAAVALSSVPEATYRLAVALPALAVLAAVGVITPLDWCRRNLSRRSGLALVAAVGLAMLAYDVQTNASRTMRYFARRLQYPQQFDTLGRAIAAGPDGAVYYVEVPPIRLRHRVVLALTHRHTIVAVPNLTDQVPRTVDLRRPAVFVILHGSSEHSLPYLRGLYPSAVVRPLANPAGVVVGYFAEVSSKALAAPLRSFEEAPCGLRRMENRHRPGKVDPYLAFGDVRALLTQEGVSEIEWRGALDVPDPLPAEIGVAQMSVSSSMMLDGVPVLTGSAGRAVLPRPPVAGSHRIAIRLALVGPDPTVFSLWWRLPGQREMVIPCNRLTPVANTQTGTTMATPVANLTR